MLIEELDKRFVKNINKSLEEHNRNVIESVLYDVLCMLYFQDYNKAVNYEKMSAEQIVKEQHKVLKEIQDMYNYNLNDDLF